MTNKTDCSHTLMLEFPQAGKPLSEEKAENALPTPHHHTNTKIDCKKLIQVRLLQLFTNFTSTWPTALRYKAVTVTFVKVYVCTYGPYWHLKGSTYYLKSTKVNVRSLTQSGFCCKHSWVHWQWSGLSNTEHTF